MKNFRIVISSLLRRIMFFANKILKDEEAARDVVQEVFIRFYEKAMISQT